MHARRSAYNEDSDLFQCKLSHVREQRSKAELSHKTRPYTAVAEVQAQPPLQAPGNLAGEGETPGGFVKPDWRPKGTTDAKKKIHTASFLHRTNHSDNRKVFEHDADLHGEDVSWQDLGNAGALYNDIGRLFAPLWATIDMSISAAEDAKCASWYAINCWHLHHLLWALPGDRAPKVLF